MNNCLSMCLFFPVKDELSCHLEDFLRPQNVFTVSLCKVIKDINVKTEMKERNEI